ncbi:hypothetical protein [Massilia sp. CF038]|uniref:hypothetical protein n=1 Tax=Massilia sp. CF038 TaxID=1881045 RepID=UPI00091407B2|nr:hypothetical protein [Massilia sp. CF038]SHG75813.1 hypothetical protein SAMN05428948_1913 [Massilia sp. CF038]
MSNLHSSRARHLIVGASLVSAAFGAIAAPAAPLDRFSLSAGAFSTEPEISVDADTNFGRIESGDQKGSRTTLPKVKAEMLIGDRQSIALDYIRYSKTYNPTLSGDTVIDGETISGTAKFDGKLRLDLSKAAYKWWFGDQNDVFAVGIGAAYYRAKVGGTASATVQGTVNGLPVSRSVSGTDSTSDDAYAPVLDLGWRHSFSQDVRIYVEASGIKKNGGKINGHIYSGAVGVEWFLAKNIGLALDYGIQKIDLRRDSDRDSALRIKLAGPSAYLKARF